MDSRARRTSEEVVSGTHQRRRATTPAARGTGSRRTGGIPSHSGKDPVGAHPLAAPRPARRVRRHPRVPRAVRLPQPAPHRPPVRVVRLDRRPLADRQPRPQPRALRPAAARRGAGLTEAQLPELVPSATVVGERRCRRWPRSGAWRPATKVVTATGDVHSAVVGLRARSATTRATSTWAPRRGCRATCRPSGPTCSTTRPRCPPPCPAGTSWPTSTRSAAAPCSGCATRPQMVARRRRGQRPRPRPRPPGRTA